MGIVNVFCTRTEILILRLHFCNLLSNIAATRNVVGECLVLWFTACCWHCSFDYCYSCLTIISGCAYDCLRIECPKQPWNLPNHTNAKITDVWLRNKPGREEKPCIYCNNLLVNRMKKPPKNKATYILSKVAICAPQKRYVINYRRAFQLCEENRQEIVR